MGSDIAVVVQLCALVGERVSNATDSTTPAQARGFQGRETCPHSGALSAGLRRQVQADRVGVCARGEQMQFRVVGGRSCGEAISFFPL